MVDLMRYAAALENVDSKSMPPVDKWDPKVSGRIDLTIKRDGTWVHEGAPIERARLVRLFSTIMKREGVSYFLVTPVEKLEINVEDAPFVAVLMSRAGAGAEQTLSFTTNVGDKVQAGAEHALEVREGAVAGESTPYVHVRRGLDALIARSVFYDLVALGETREVDGERLFGVWSGGVFFPLGASEEVFG